MNPYFYIRQLQLTLFDLEEPSLRYVVRRHHATRLHWDFRVEANKILYSWFMHEPPTADPARPVWFGLAGPHDRRYIHSERVIDEGKSGAGPTLVEDKGVLKPLVSGYTSQDWEFHERFLAGKIPLAMDGGILKGGYVLERFGDRWRFQKSKDAYAITKPLNWTGISPLSGKTLQDLVNEHWRGTK